VEFFPKALNSTYGLRKNEGFFRMVGW